MAVDYLVTKYPIVKLYLWAMSYCHQELELNEHLNDFKFQKAIKPIIPEKIKTTSRIKINK